jgi:hypothetical protein
VRISPLLVLISVLVGASVGSWIGGLFGGFVAALLAIPAAGAFQVIVREGWRLSGPPPRELPVAATAVAIETTVHTEGAVVSVEVSETIVAPAPAAITEQVAAPASQPG